MKKTLLNALLCAVLLSLTVMGCASDPPSPASASKPPASPSSKAPEKAPARPLEKISLPAGAPIAEELYGAGLRLYLMDEAGELISGLLFNPDQGSRGRVIVSADGADGYVLGEYDVSGDSWGTVSLLDKAALCYNNYDSLAFIDTAAMENTGFSLDFQAPKDSSFRVSSVARDSETGEYAVIYQVSSYIKSADGEYRPWMLFQNDPQIGAADAHMEFQRFDADGRFLDRAVTDLEPLYGNEVVPCQPNLLRRGRLSYLAKSYFGSYVTHDFSTGATQALPCDGAVLDGAMAAFRDGAEPDGEVAVLYTCTEADGVYTFRYDWYEKGKLLYTAQVEEGLDEFTSAIGNADYRLQLTALDHTAKTMEQQAYILIQGDPPVFKPGGIFHRLDFLHGSGQVVRQYSRESLGEPLLTSPDGRYQIFNLGERSGGDAYFRQELLLDTQTGQFTPIGARNNPNDCFITPDNRYIVLGYATIDSCDLATGVWSQPLPEFVTREYSEAADWKLPLGLIYDPGNELFLLQCADHFTANAADLDKNVVGNLFIRVYDKDWKLLRKLDTGIPAPWDYKAYGPYGVPMELREPGVLGITKDSSLLLNYL